MLPGFFKTLFSPFKRQTHRNLKEKICGQLDIAADELKFYTYSQIVWHYLQNESKKDAVLITKRS